MPKWICASDASLVHLRKTALFTTVMPSKVFESAGCKRPLIMGVDGFAKRLVLDAEAGLDMTPSSEAGRRWMRRRPSLRRRRDTRS